MDETEDRRQERQRADTAAADVTFTTTPESLDATRSVAVDDAASGQAGRR